MHKILVYSQAVSQDVRAVLTHQNQYPNIPSKGRQIIWNDQIVQELSGFQIDICYLHQAARYQIFGLYSMVQMCLSFIEIVMFLL